jgi:hypothetical protein
MKAKQYQDGKMAVERKTATDEHRGTATDDHIRTQIKSEAAGHERLDEGAQPRKHFLMRACEGSSVFNLLFPR